MELTIEERVKEIEKRLDGSGTFARGFWWRALALTGHMYAVNLAAYGILILLVVLMSGVAAM